MMKRLFTALMCMTTGIAMSQTFTLNGVSFEMVSVEGGTFYMGAQRASADEPNYDSELSEYVNTASPVHTVTLSDYHIGKYEVTQALWEAAIGEDMLKTDDGIGIGDNYPVYYLTYSNCLELIYTLNNKLKDQLNGGYFYIPTEAQWEYAARGGHHCSETLYAGSNTSNDVSWHRNISGQKTHEVGQLAPNALGLYDMSGNVQEWCLDTYVNSYSNYPTNNDPVVTTESASNIVRGGHFMSPEQYTKVYERGYQGPAQSNYYTGLRLVLIDYNKEPNAIDQTLSTTPTEQYDIYTIGGQLIKANADKGDIKGLQRGVYIINNELFIVK